jgi:tetratricopeptide (TPR) repeat protein
VPDAVSNVTTKSFNETDTTLELAKLYSDRGDFLLAIEKLREAAGVYFKARSFEKYLKCQNSLLRMYAESEDSENIRLTKESLQDLVLKEGFELNAKTYYTLGICACYKDQYDLGLEYFEKSLSLAIERDNKEDMCYAINALAINYFRLGRYQEALKEIRTLQVFFQVLDLPDLKLSSQMTNGNVLCKLKKYDQAIEVMWDCYELLRKEKNLFMYVYLLVYLGRIYKESGDPETARLYLRLARKSIDPAVMKVIAKTIEELLAELGEARSGDFDLVLEIETNRVSEKRMGQIDFKNQFVLLDMLRLFMKQPGVVYSKENLARQIWKQEYDPQVHDNKIYVTIKRLRKLIEPDSCKPRYIFRAKNGYYLNKGAKILVHQS